MDWLDLRVVQGTLKSLLQHHSSKASILSHSAFLIVQLSHPYMTTEKTTALTRQTFVDKVMSLLFNMLSRLVIAFLPRSKPDILEWEVKWTLGSITMNIANGGDRIPVELFQILKDDAVNVLPSICQQIGKTQQWPQDWKRSVFIPIPKKSNAKEFSNYHTTALISHANKLMLKILQDRLQRYVNHELPDVQAGFRKGRGTRDQIANIRWII